MEEVYIYWSGPYQLELVPEREASFDWGIYAISRKWAGSEKLLYIGQSYYQCMLDRVWCHRNSWIYNYRGTMLVRFGTIGLEASSRHSKQRTNDIEALLIYRQKPMHNTQHKWSYRGRPLLIINEWRRGCLDEVVCSEDDFTEYL